MKTKLKNHQRIQVALNKSTLCFEDGTPFFYLADTLWYAMSVRTSWKDFQKIVLDREAKGFTAIQCVVGVPPEIPIDSPYAASGTGMPFVQHKNEWGINVAYFSEVDRRIAFFIEHNLVPVIFGGWGHHIDDLGEETICAWWKEIVRRYSHVPVIFSLCGEVDFGTNTPFSPSITAHIRKSLPVFLPKFLVKAVRFVRNGLSAAVNESSSLSQAGRERIEKWNRIGSFVAASDKHKNLRTIHVQAKTTARILMGDPSWLDIDSIQSGHSEESINFMIQTLRENSGKGKPIINLEPWYEGILGTFDASYQALAFWVSVTYGAAGHAYGAHGLWNMSTHTDEFLVHWGKADWKMALQYKGATLLGKLSQLIHTS